jgi:hypothetical protein
MRASEDPELRIRMIDVAANLGWLSSDDRRAELGRLIAERFAHATLTAADVDLACTLDKADALDDVRQRVRAASSVDDVGHAAMLACLGASDDRERLLQALTSPSEAEVQIAQVYLMHRPISDVAELRGVAAGITRMSDANAQVRALDTLADRRLSDPVALGDLARLFPVARSIDVQRAIAGVLIRSDYQSLATVELVRTLREHRFKSPSGRDLIDVLINRLEAAT